MREAPIGSEKRGKAPKTAPEMKARAYYDARYPDFARKCAMLGLSDTQIAGFLDVPVPVMEAWKKLFPEFWAMLRDGRTRALGDVAAALYERATGWSHPAVKVWIGKTKDAAGNEVVDVHEHPIVEKFPPDVEAAKFILKNRAPEQWADSSKTTVDGSLDVGLGGISALLEAAKRTKA